MQPFVQDVGMIVVNNTGPLVTMCAVREGMRSGFSSPLRYVAANPSSIVGFTALAFGFHGPTMNLALPCLRGVPTAITLLKQWTTSRNVPVVLLSTVHKIADDNMRIRCVFASLDSHRRLGRTVDDGIAAWLCHADDIASEVPV